MKIFAKSVKISDYLYFLEYIRDSTHVEIYNLSKRIDLKDFLKDKVVINLLPDKLLKSPIEKVVLGIPQHFTYNTNMNDMRGCVNIDFYIRYTSEETLKFVKICEYFISLGKQVILSVDFRFNYDLIVLIYVSTLHRYLNYTSVYSNSFIEIKNLFSDLGRRITNTYKSEYMLINTSNIQKELLLRQFILGSIDKPLKNEYTLSIYKFNTVDMEYNKVDVIKEIITDEYFIVWNLDYMFYGDYIITISEKHIEEDKRTDIEKLFGKRIIPHLDKKGQETKIIFSLNISTSLYEEGIYRFKTEYNLFFDMAINESRIKNNPPLENEQYLYKILIENFPGEHRKIQGDPKLNKLSDRNKLLHLIFDSKPDLIEAALTHLKGEKIPNVQKEDIDNELTVQLITIKRPVKKEAPKRKFNFLPPKLLNLNLKSLKYKQLHVSESTSLKDTIFEDIPPITINEKYILDNLLLLSHTKNPQQTNINLSGEVFSQKRAFLFSITIKAIEKCGITYNNILDSLKDLNTFRYDLLLKVCPTEGEISELLRKRGVSNFIKTFNMCVFEDEGEPIEVDFNTLSISEIEKYSLCSYLYTYTFRWVELFLTFDDLYKDYIRNIKRYTVFYTEVLTNTNIKALFSIVLRVVSLIKCKDIKGIKLDTIDSIFTYQCKDGLSLIEIIKTEFKLYLSKNKLQCKFESIVEKSNILNCGDIGNTITHFNNTIVLYNEISNKNIVRVLKDKKKVFIEDFTQKIKCAQNETDKAIQSEVALHILLGESSENSTCLVNLIKLLKSTLY